MHGPPLPTALAPACAIPERCQLEHRVFASFGEFAFRRSETDGIAVMSVNLGDRQASIPLKSLGRELAIDENTPDGRMFALIGDSLDYVARLQPGDRLPLEVRTGQASWAPRPEHHRIAALRVRLRLADWHAPEIGWAGREQDVAGMLALADCPLLHAAVEAAARRAAVDLGVGTPADVIARLDDVANELAFIEALRSLLLRRVEHAGRAAALAAHRIRSTAAQSETARQVVQLLIIAVRQIRARFEEVDAQTGEVLGVLRNIESQRIFIRSNRDWLYRHHRAWTPILDLWDERPSAASDALTSLFSRTYQFLAPRFMLTTEWQITTRPRQRRPIAARMTW